jgi:hypothetical protein
MNKVIGQILKKTGISVIILISGAVLGYLLLCLAFCIRISPKKAESTMNFFAGEGYYPRASLKDGTADHFHDYYPDVLDYFTDELICSYSTDNPEGNFFTRCFSFYGLYWHGYIVVLRPLFALLNLSGIRILNLVAQILIAAYLAYLLYSRTKRKRYAFAWLTVYYLLLPNCLSVNFQNSDIFYIGALAAIVFLQFKEKFVKNFNYIFLFLVAGMCTSYFDFLTYPIMSFAVPAVMLVLFWDELKEWKGLWKIFHPVLSFFAWGVGYLAFWSEKWLLSDLITGGSVLRTAVGETHFRTTTAMVDRLLAVNKNWIYMAWWPIMAVVIIWLAFWIVCIVRRGWKKDFRVFGMAFICLTVPLWYLIASEHTGTHTIFTWRNAVAAVMALLFIVCITTEEAEAEKKEAEKKLLGSVGSRITAVLLSLILGFILFRVVPTNEKIVNNYQSDGTTEPVPGGINDALEFQFVPGHWIITEFELLMKSDDPEGYYEVILMDGDRALYSTKAYVKDANAADIHYMKVLWPVHKGKSYTVRVSTEHIKDGGSIGFAYEDELNELSGNDVHPFLQVIYYTVPVELRFIAWNIITFVSVLLMAEYMLLYLFQNRKKNNNI